MSMSLPFDKPGTGIPGRENHQDKSEKGFCVLRKQKENGAVCNELREERKERDWRSGQEINQWENIDQKADTMKFSIKNGKKSHLPTPWVGGGKRELWGQNYNKFIYVIQEHTRENS